MADNYTQATMDPFIPKDLVTDKEKEFLLGFGLTTEDAGEELYFFADDYRGGAYTEPELAKAVFPDLEIEPEETEIELDEDYMIEVLQRFIKRSEGKLKYITLEGAYTCSKMRPGEFGGFACFITEDDAKVAGTASWLRDMEKTLNPVEDAGMVLDVSRVSPMTRFKMLGALCKIASDDLSRLKEDLPYYKSGGDAQKDMESWEAGCSDFLLQIAAIKKKDK